MRQPLDAGPVTARGRRIAWAVLPIRIRAAVEAWLDEPVAAAATQTGGMSPGAAVRLRTASGRRVFVKAVGPDPNARAPEFYRREAVVSALLPPSVPAPRLLWTHDEGAGGWVVLAFEDVDGRQPILPWRPNEVDRVVAGLIDLSEALTPSPVVPDEVGRAEAWGVATGGWWAKVITSAPDRLDAWTMRSIDALADLETGAADAVAGETLLHLDLRDDNLLLTAERVVVLDWTHARVGASWLDPVLMAPSVAMQGGPDPEAWVGRFPAVRSADPAAVTAAVVAIAGALTYGGLQPAPPGLPTLTAFMAAQGAEARRWVRVRTGWS